MEKNTFLSLACNCLPSAMGFALFIGIFMLGDFLFSKSKKKIGTSDDYRAELLYLVSRPFWKNTCIIPLAAVLYIAFFGITAAEAAELFPNGKINLWIFISVCLVGLCIFIIILGIVSRIIRQWASTELTAS